MSHVIIITDRAGNEISVPGPHFAETEEHEPITVVIDIEKVIELYNINTNQGKKEEG